MISGIAALVARIPSFKQVLYSCKNLIQEDRALAQEMKDKCVFDKIQGFIAFDMDINHAFRSPLFT
jgi:hypothetical protein